MYQVLEIFETKFIAVIYYDNFGIFISDFVVELFLFIFSLYVYIKANLSSELYKENILVYLYNVIKDLIKNLCVQQFYTSNNYLSFFILNVFTLLLLMNVYGLLPFSFSVTSQLSLTVFLSFSVCFGVTIVGFLNMSYDYLYLFITKEGDMPMMIVPFLIVIEFLSYGARYFSLGLRLFANMMAGHSLMVILSKFFLGFFDKFINLFDIFFLLLLVLMLGVVLLEVGVSLLQAYVFVLLISIYLNEAIEN